MHKRPLDYYVLWCVALLSLLINAGLVYVLVVVRAGAGEGTQTAAQAVAALRMSSIDYAVHIDQSLPVSLTIPLSTTVSVPISLTLPIDTEFNYSLRTLLGDFPIDIPVHMLIPVNVQPLVPVQLTVPVSTTVPVVFDVPVRIELAQTGLGESLEQMQAYLVKLSADLRANPFLRSKAE